ncbi:MAG: glycoside hydrolase family 3 C-terminal domain-containing protein [Eubacterium sp.]|nr:glycoside hydrolase family 3 C-terminal domain-containing protein [Eubacterium sp.]
MDKIKSKFSDTVNDVTSTTSQAENAGEAASGEISDEMKRLCRKAAAEGIVLIKNDGTLPLKKGTEVSLFSRTQIDWFFVGYGSGGDVNCPQKINLVDGIRNCDELELNEKLADVYAKWVKNSPPNHGIWGQWPYSQKEMPLDIIAVQQSKGKSDTAVVTIGRAAGEDRDSAYENGCYLLSKAEVDLLDVVTDSFDKVIVLLNTGGIMDMSWMKKYGDKISAVLYVFQGGMESGNAVADVLCGKVNPSGRLADTIARSYFDYPSSENFGGRSVNNYEEDIFVGYRYFESFDKANVVYPFGYGLSYTDFDINYIDTEAFDDGFEITAKVTNIGKRSGRQVVQLYAEKPCGKLGNPARELVAFAKTKDLAPKESEEVKLWVDAYQLTSYDDCGSTNHAGAYVAEEGEYTFYLGENVREAQAVFSYFQEETEVYEQLRQAAAPQEHFEVLHAEIIDGKTVLRKKAVAKQKFDLATRINNHLPKDIEMTGDKGLKLIDVKNGKCTMEEFVAQLDLDELEAITRGDYTMDSPLGAKGNAGAYAGVLKSLRDKGIPAVITTDGPSGIRLVAYCSLIPIGTLLACTYDTELVEAIHTELGKEMNDRGTDVLLAPGMNIHRNPLCGRNFEYYSEDPYITGKMAAAAVRGVQSQGVSACPKHFACNNQEMRRTKNDSRLSERALREIYLKGFEICIREAKPKNIMTSYNRINGVYGHYNYDLCTTILRGEWGYEGNVMTDWWLMSEKSPENPAVKDQAYRVRAQIDLFMPGGPRVTNRKPDGTLLSSLGKPFGITVGEIQRSAMNVLKSAMDIKL